MVSLLSKSDIQALNIDTVERAIGYPPRRLVTDSCGG